MITKEMLLKGSKLVKTIHLTSVDDDINIRPLTQAEVSEYNRITAKSMGSMETGRNTKLKINLEKSTIAEAEAQAYAVATALVDEDWSIEEVQSLNGLVFNELFENVAKISALDADVTEELKKFLENE